jgi:hypothetical protein
LAAADVAVGAVVGVKSTAVAVNTAVTVSITNASDGDLEDGHADNSGSVHVLYYVVDV